MVFKGQRVNRLAALRVSTFGISVAFNHVIVAIYDYIVYFSKVSFPASYYSSILAPLDSR